MRVVEIDDFPQFEREFQEHRSDAVLLALFFGNRDPATGESWCSDCRAALPVVMRVAERTEGAVLLFCNVGVRDQWKEKPENPYRTSAVSHVKCIPTLIRYNSGVESARLEEGQILNEEATAALFST